MTTFEELSQVFGAELAAKIDKKAHESDGRFMIRQDGSKVVYEVSVSHCGTETKYSKVLDPWYLEQVWTAAEFISRY